MTTTLVLRQLVMARARRGKAVLYGSHVLELVEKPCDRVIVLHSEESALPTPRLDLAG